MPAGGAVGMPVGRGDPEEEDPKGVNHWSLNCWNALNCEGLMSGVKQFPWKYGGSAVR